MVSVIDNDFVGFALKVLNVACERPENFSKTLALTSWSRSTAMSFSNDFLEWRSDGFLMLLTSSKFFNISDYCPIHFPTLDTAASVMLDPNPVKPFFASLFKCSM